MSYINDILLSRRLSYYLQNSETPLHISCQQGHIEVVKLLLDKGADIHQRRFVSIMRHINDIDILLLRELFYYQQDNCTSFHMACYGGNIEIVKLLIDKGADIHQENKVSIIIAEPIIYFSSDISIIYYCYDDASTIDRIKVFHFITLAEMVPWKLLNY